MFKLFIGLFFVLVSSASHAKDYTVHGLSGVYTPYYTAIIDLSFNGETVTGSIRPLNGDSTPHIAVSGTNYATGRMRLNVTLKGAPLELDFEKHISAHVIEWRATNVDYLVFSRPRRSSIPRAQKTLSVPFGCGIPYGTLTVALFKPHDGQIISDIVGKNLSSATSRSQGYYGGNYGTPDTKNNVFDLRVPLGSEDHIAEKLRQDPRVFYADLRDGGGCGVRRSDIWRYQTRWYPEEVMSMRWYLRS